MTDPTTAHDVVEWRDSLPDLAAGAAVAVLGFAEIARMPFADPRLGWVVAGTALAVGLSRRLPLLALTLVWLTCGYQVTLPLQVLYVQVTIAAVAFGTARWGRPVTVFLSGMSIPAAGVVAVLFASSSIFRVVFDLTQYQRVLDAVRQVSGNGSWHIATAVLGMSVLGVPWLAGLTVRFSRRAAESQVTATAAQEEAARALRESEQAKEIARLREEQTKLAHDVHDVVGHSLAVILAQAESAQFLDEADTGALRLSMANIAASARGSLQDVRQVLTPTPQTASSPGELHDLVDGVRASGHTVSFAETGTARPLPPDLATVAYRVLQEMLTNAIRHGRRDGRITVDLHWSDDLRIEVSNPVGTPEAPDGGQGIEGMRRRLQAVGGRLEVAGQDGTYTANAVIPTRAGQQ